MGLRMDEMRLFAKLSPDQRLREGLVGARLPARGFYRVKTISRDQLTDAQAARNMTTVRTPSLLSGLFRSMSRQGLRSAQTADKADVEALPDNGESVGEYAQDQPVQEV